jgi:hypothetical protein
MNFLRFGGEEQLAALSYQRSALSLQNASDERLIIIRSHKKGIKAQKGNIVNL